MVGYHLASREGRIVMALFAPKCPVSHREQTWIQENIGWFRDLFGDGPLGTPVLLPGAPDFPWPHGGTDQDIRGLAGELARYMGVQADIDIEFSDDIDHLTSLQRLASGRSRTSQPAGTYTDQAGRPVITLDRSNATNLARMTAVIAHELGHVRLLREGRISPGRKDGEPLTDLLTVYLGTGIFTANAAFSFNAQASGAWRAQRLGYLTEQMYGYALACYATLRAEPAPDWVRHLDTNPRVYMKHGIRYLRSH
jgi:hypothetical protein